MNTTVVFNVRFSVVNRMKGERMVDDLTAQAFSTSKAVVEVATELLKLIAKKLEQEYYNNKNVRNTSNNMEQVANKESNFVEISDECVADAFENKLKQQGFKYERINDEKFVVESDNRKSINNVMIETAKEVAQDNIKEHTMVADLVENKLKEQGMSYERQGNNFTVSEKDKPTLDKLKKEVKAEVKNKSAKMKAEKNASLKQKIQKYKEKSQSKDKMRQRDKVKQKIKTQNKVR